MFVSGSNVPLHPCCLVSVGSATREKQISYYSLHWKLCGNSSLYANVCTFSPMVWLAQYILCIWWAFVTIIFNIELYSSSSCLWSLLKIIISIINPPFFRYSRLVLVFSMGCIDLRKTFRGSTNYWCGA